MSNRPPLDKPVSSGLEETPQTPTPQGPSNKKPVVKKPWQRTRQFADLEDQIKKTDDSQGNDTDVNNIVARFARTGQLPPSTAEPFYGDVSNLQGDLTEIIQRGEDAKAELAKLQQEQQAQEAKDLEDQKAQAEANAAKLAALEEQIAKTTPPD